MATTYDPVPDAIEFLSRKSPPQRHALARILDYDGRSLEVIRWLIRQQDCDRATAAMIFWGLRAANPSRQSALDLAGRNAVISEISDRAISGHFADCDVGWDGKDVWSQTLLIGAPALDGITEADPKAAATLSGPFDGTKPDPVEFAFFDHDYGDDDIFDSLWRVSPHSADAVDWLVGRSPDTWERVVDDLQPSHAEDILEWMKDHRDCATGERPAPVLLIEDFDFWCWRTNIGNLVKRPREAAIAQWQDALAWRQSNSPKAGQAHAATDTIGEVAAEPSAIESFVYGGNYTGDKTQLDRAWRQFSVLSFLGAALFLAVGRWSSLKAGFALFLCWVAMISFYLGSVKMGGTRRILLWWMVVIALTALGTVLL